MLSHCTRKNGDLNRGTGRSNPDFAFAAPMKAGFRLYNGGNAGAALWLRFSRPSSIQQESPVKLDINPPLRLLAAFQDTYPDQTPKRIVQAPGRDMWLAADL